MIERAIEDGSLKGISLDPQLNPLSHLQFIDDTLLMGKPTIRGALAFKKALNLFMTPSRALIN